MSKGKILVVDDDRLVLATLSYGLTQAGFEVIDADNGDDAILLAREHRPELALLDIRMEGLTGFDVAAYLREFLQTPFMFLSAFADEATVAKVKELGAVAYLVKPLDISQIVPAVEAAFARSAPVPQPVPVPAPAAAPVPPPSELPALLDPTAMAVGVLMHRYSLPRDEALSRLLNLAAADGHSVPEQARRIVDAVELLARPGQK
ncbi:response regulator [Roseateles sp.]|uniref:response regulator n=1 Tax=Roseateles sp. TaxID=1971397 RepID=UPI00326772F9